MDMYTKVYEFIEKHGLIQPGDTVLLSLSAGKDSMALLHVLHKLSDKLQCTLGIFHLNHLMRGEESDDDEQLVRKTAESLNIPCYVEHFDFIANKESKGSFEERAREVRYTMLKNMASQYGYTKIATGHNENDHVETILMRIFTGTGVAGLQGIKPLRDNIIRPLLDIPVEDIYSFLQEKKIHWREDSSNEDLKYQRNLVRQSIIPVIEENFISMRNSVKRLAEIAGDYEELLKKLAYEKVRVISNNSHELVISLAEVIHDKRLVALILSDIIRNRSQSYPSFSILNEIYKNLITEKSNSLIYKNNYITILKRVLDEEIVISATTGDETNVTGPWEYTINIDKSSEKKVFLNELNISLVLRLVDHGFFQKNRQKSNYVFCNITNANEVCIRNRRSGDKILLVGGTKKIKDLLIEKKLDNDSKNCVPLLIVNSDIAAFMPGLVFNMTNRVSEKYFVREDSQRILALYVDTDRPD